MAIINGTPNHDLLAAKLQGTPEADQIFGFAGRDEMLGLGGNDLLVGGPDGDYLDGGEGTDTASYAGSAAAVWVVLANDDPERNGDAAGDRLVSIENLTGGDHDDSLTGDDGANVIRGGKGEDFLTGWLGDDRLEGGDRADTLVGHEGADRLFGGAGGNDWVVGGLGRDELTGGGGGDFFVFGGLDESGTGSTTRDLVKDFSHSQGDKLYFKGFEFEDDWSFAGKAAFGGPDEVRYRHADGKTVVELNADADAVPEMTVALVGTIDLAAGDFLFSP